jgi:hypothetical protein
MVRVLEGDRVTDEISRPEARSLVDQGIASWCNGCRDVRLLKTAPAIRGASCSPGARMMHAWALGEAWARAAIDGWKPGVRSVSTTKKDFRDKYARARETSTTKWFWRVDDSGRAGSFLTEFWNDHRRN